jgi:hypothetical protein
MLVARRDPILHTDVHNAAPSGSSDYSVTRASKLAGFMTAIQLVGTLLAVPLAIASAYSFYRANFSPETTCQSLRSGIVAMLDKSVDAATRRILVRRDIEAFEKSCGAVDPDATAAFKTLLAADKTVAPAAAPIAPKVQRSGSLPKEPVRKAEPRPQTATKQPVTTAAPAAMEPVRRDSMDSDAQWLDAVRQALVTHKSESAAKPQSTLPVVQPEPQEATLSIPAKAAAPAGSASVPATPLAAPALSPPIAITPPIAAQPSDLDHPVPPGSIPETLPPTDAAKPDEQGRSRISKWISAVPLLGPVIDNARH